MLLEISKQLTRTVLISFIILGIIGNLLNLYIFTRRRFLRSSCTLYFIAALINNIIVILISAVNRLLIDGFSIDIESKSVIICKLGSYIEYVILALTPYFIILACFDRYCSSSTSVIYHCLTNKAIAKRCICGAIILASILYLHVTIFFDIQIIVSDSICYPQVGFYDSFWRIFFLIVYGIFPSICMVILCFLTGRNFRNQLRQINPGLPTSHDTYRRVERNLIAILISKCCTQILCALPFAVINLLGMFISKNSTTYIILLRTFSLPLFAGYTVSFYINIILSPIYRRELTKLIHFF